MALILKASGKPFLKTLRGKAQPGRIIGQGVHLKRGGTIGTVVTAEAWGKEAGVHWFIKIPAKHHASTNRTVEDGLVVFDCLYMPSNRMKIFHEATAEADPKNPAATPARTTNMAAFMKGFGCLKGKDVFTGDAVEFEREMREEWQ